MTEEKHAEKKNLCSAEKEHEKETHGPVFCECGHCHTSEVSNKKNNTESFLSLYGKTLTKIIISAVLIILGFILPVEDIFVLFIFIAAALISGYELIIGCFKGVIKGEFFGEDTLMLLAATVAFFVGQPFEGALIILLFSIGELMENIATDNSRKKIAGLAELKSEYVNLVTEHGVIQVSPEKVEIGSIIEIKSGEQVPIDGILISENAEFDTKAVTGESNYCSVESGGKVYSGSLNAGKNVIRIKTEKLYADSTVEKIISTVESATAQKAKSQKFITVFAKYYTPIIVALGILIATIIPLFDGYTFNKWIYKALSFIVISCPCSLVISVPLGYFIGIGRLAKQGILVKGSNYLEVLAKVDTVVFDKTGTLTKGNFKVEKINIYEEDNAINEKYILSAVKAVEEKSNHPIAKAICSHIKYKSGISAENIREIPGKGMTALYDGKEIVIGNSNLMKDYGVATDKKDFAGTVIYVSSDKKLLAEIFIADEIREDAADAIKRLKALGVKHTAILSGDSNEIVNSVADRLGISERYGEMLPEGKTDKLKLLKKRSESKLMYCGDGINDAPVLAMADVGVAMGGLGSEIAVESSDVVIMNDKIDNIATSIKHAKKVRKIVAENIFGSVTVKVAIMAISIFFGIPVWIAIFADVGVMILAILNSLRNYRL